jgi:hypothetical protein
MWAFEGEIETVTADRLGHAAFAVLEKGAQLHGGSRAPFNLALNEAALRQGANSPKADLRVTCHP